MKAYVILAHKQPAQLSRLIRTLSDGDSLFFVHIDRRADIKQFESLAEFGDTVQFVPRVKTEWASFGLVEAVLNGLRAVRRSDKPVSHVVLLSGQDYPIKNNEYIRRFMEQAGNQSFIEYFALPNPAKWKPNGGLYRVNKYFMGLRTYQRYGAKAANFLSAMLPFLQRKAYNGMKAYAGSMWWIIDHNAMNYILDFVTRNPRYAAFHRFTFAADELFFHMILLNAKNDKLASVIVNTDKRFIKWSGKEAAHPETISREDIQQLVESDALFARKFDGADTEVLDLVDKYCLAKTS